ncbi:DEAD/DEAH box helicase [Teladorsagia circumcincta]|uniref:DEAD/DEAH box helicase n=1 Tax=Teladorsagia circumcincta TaxID=45464 RepID=A0A2G9U0N1_TELCI|nr:DEAD/DEAH box helicase [Teladorsagia circumcincta]
MRDLAPPLLNMEPSEDFDLCGLPKSAKEVFVEKRNIKQLYDWQRECLSDHRLLRGSNCIVSLPTGAGKTLIAEVLMLREAIVNKRSSILVLPYVAIVQEKISSLSMFEETFGIRIEEYAANKGRIPPIKRRKEVSIYVATIEKANSLINSLIETESLDRVGLVVVDERLAKADPDGLCQLLIGVIPQRSVLIFCPTKKNCESVANMIARCVPEDVRKKRLEEKKKVLEAMKEDCEGQDGVICVVCATSTLAAGVNMPARRVIIKAPLVGCSPLGKAQYMQMIGRAGRAGFDQKGDSITIVRRGSEERQVVVI